MYRTCPTRTVFLHYHIFKNAGTTIDRVFEANCGVPFQLESDDPGQPIRSDALLQVLRDRPQVLYVSSHAIRPPRPVAAGYHFVDIVILRHPIDRFRSIYDFSRANVLSQSPTERAAKRFGLGDFARWMATETPCNFFDPQTTFMGNGGDFFHPPTEQDLEVAVRRTLDVRLLGTVELLPQSLSAASCYLRGVRPTIDLITSATRANATPDRAGTLHERIALVRAALGPVGFGRLEEALRYDLRLWESASAEVQRRWGLFAPWAGPSHDAAQRFAEGFAPEPHAFDGVG
jgi:hypothetical protein